MRNRGIYFSWCRLWALRMRTFVVLCRENGLSMCFVYIVVCTVVRMNVFREFIQCIPHVLVFVVDSHTSHAARHTPHIHTYIHLYTCMRHFGVVCIGIATAFQHNAFFFSFFLFFEINKNTLTLPFVAVFFVVQFSVLLLLLLLLVIASLVVSGCSHSEP